MVITYHGNQFFKVSFGDTTLAFDPIAKSAKAPSTKFGADIALISVNHEDFNGVEQVTHGAKEPFVVFGPGEYEFGNVTARGYGTKTVYDEVERYNTIYQVRLEEINMIFLGAQSSDEIDPKILSELGDVDILFVPIGGGDVLDVPAASKLAVKLEAKLIIPMHYNDTALKAFLKEIGAENEKKTDKLTLKKREVSEMEGEVRVLAV
jgi:L-ascorbate metabolism protein UlaG (beta-lactamase superfamily)